ncbi:MAG: [protein-PII] uridylyltransferase [Gammaproteobacteria bacterium]|nr:[protein-PII] uridylyltransferase [Gammaproteobacteria bacterium]NNF59838.1 [protein-PII] uridylyltransferase [Gammaproteobacteria bacterium]NNM21288.1 [protein-PII] uridylyltransferase [Gammaproteobacteria bacterium]
MSHGAHVAGNSWPPVHGLAEVVAKPAAQRLAAYKDAISRGDELLAQRFAAGEDIETLVRDRAKLIDELLVHAWTGIDGPGDVALVAVGGYGRGELHPGSDIDIMLLLPDHTGDSWREPAEKYFTFLWDIGLEIGHSVRTISDCVRESEADITVATALMESRCLCGNGDHFASMRAAVGPDRVWPSAEFFEAKLAEQVARHKRYDETPYKLEPNVKGSPGGLRDIQMIGWVAKRHFGVATSRELVELGFLTAQEIRRLRAGRAFLWQLRFALHVLTGRREDRLLFDHQVRIAKMLGYSDSNHNLAVEQLMQRYYRTVMELGLLNEMLLQLFQEAILMRPDAPATPINERFHEHNGYLALSADDVFERNPAALLETFQLLQENPHLRGVSANTIRHIRDSLHLIDDDFRAAPAHKKMFMDILRADRFVTTALRRMNAYGVLGRYLPEFGQIVGRMQYDLFHTYTVDAHTLFVLRNLRRFAVEPANPAYPHCSEIIRGLAKPELAYLAALFHDIAKGRGGDHSMLGAADAKRFCLDHGLSEYEARLVAWLVSKHLILSVTAQKKDIDDPQVIHEFATEVGDEQHLEYLYVLTVADLTGTNPKLWNSWKASLFEELFLLTRRALRRGLGNPIDRDTLINETQSEALQLLAELEVDREKSQAVWTHLPDGYFLRHSPQEIAWHTQLLASHTADQPLVAVDATPTRGGTSLFVYSPDRMHTFAMTTAVLDEMGFNIIDARISRSRDSASIEAFRVTEASGEALIDADRAAALTTAISRELNADAPGQPGVTRRAPRQVRMFSTPTRINFSDDQHNRRTMMELTAGDRPGLLSQVGDVFRRYDIVIETAKITTVGERAEDVFYITDATGNALSGAQCEQLNSELLESLDQQ